MERFPIFKACFSANGEEVLATSNHSKVLYVYDMLAGKLIPVHQVRGKISFEHMQPIIPPQVSLYNSVYNHFFHSMGFLKIRVSFGIVFGKCLFAFEVMHLNETSELFY